MKRFVSLCVGLLLLTLIGNTVSGMMRVPVPNSQKIHTVTFSENEKPHRMYVRFTIPWKIAVRNRDKNAAVNRTKFTLDTVSDTTLAIQSNRINNYGRSIYDVPQTFGPFPAGVYRIDLNSRQPMTISAANGDAVFFNAEHNTPKGFRPSDLIEDIKLG